MKIRESACEKGVLMPKREKMMVDEWTFLRLCHLPNR